jgi:hypothetical protein
MVLDAIFPQHLVCGLTTFLLALKNKIISYIFLSIWQCFQARVTGLETTIQAHFCQYN